MIAFVFSGGGNRGALQVGAAQALLAHGIVPDILVGTSVGAINAAYLAHHPSLVTALMLEHMWGRVTTEDVYPGSRMTILWRLLKERISLFPNDSFYRFLCRHMSPGVETFADLPGAQLYIVATHLETGRMHVFGERLSDRLIDAVMASTALPPFHPPWQIDGECYVDGGAVSGLPLRVAVWKGARIIYALHLLAPLGPLPLAHSLGDVANRALSALVQQQVALDFDVVARTRSVTLHHIELCPPPNLQMSFRDFSHSAELVASGREQTGQYLAQYLEARRTRPATRRERFLTPVQKTIRQMNAIIQDTTERALAVVDSLGRGVRTAVDDVPDMHPTETSREAGAV
jgi:NTE family protein